MGDTWESGNCGVCKSRAEVDRKTAVHLIGYVLTDRETKITRRSDNMSSRRNSLSGSGSRRGSIEGDVGLFGLQKPLKKGKPVSTVKISFMGKNLELLVPMNDDLNIYDGRVIEGSSEAKSKNTWVEMFDMIDVAFNNLQQQNKELKRTVNELSSKVNKFAFHDRKETNKNIENLKKVSNEKVPENNPNQAQEINKKVENKIQKVEENILQWIDEESKTLKDSLEKDINTIRSEVDTKNIEINSKVQTSIRDFKEEVNEKVALIDNKLNESTFDNDNACIELEDSTGAARAILDLKNKLHKNCNTLRFLCSEPLSVHFSVWMKGEMKIPRNQSDEQVLFNWVNCNVGGAVDDDLVNDIHSIIIPVSGPYLLNLGGQIHGNSGQVWLTLNKREKLLDGGRSDIVELDEDDVLQVYCSSGTTVSNVSFVGLLLRPRAFIAPGTTM